MLKKSRSNEMNVSILSRDDIAIATREELVVMLEQDYCIQCYDHETIDELREAAYQNWDTKTTGESK
jgi:hypothetical protein